MPNTYLVTLHSDMGFQKLAVLKHINNAKMRDL